MSQDTSELRAQLDELERDLESVRKNAADIRGSVSEAEDPSDRGALIQAADEQDSLAEQLEARRADLLRKLEASGQA
jgi:uncharacterized membrane protein